MSKIIDTGILKALKVVNDNIHISAMNATVLAADEIRHRTIPRTPLDDGILRDSLYSTDLNETQSISNDRKIEAVIGSRGAKDPETGFKYAVVQHENMNFKHQYGESKFLENAAHANKNRFVQLVKKHVKMALSRSKR